MQFYPFFAIIFPNKVFLFIQILYHPPILLKLHILNINNIFSTSISFLYIRILSCKSSKKFYIMSLILLEYYSDFQLSSSSLSISGFYKNLLALFSLFTSYNLFSRILLSSAVHKVALLSMFFHEKFQTKVHNQLNFKQLIIQLTFFCEI